MKYFRHKIYLGFTVYCFLYKFVIIIIMNVDNVQKYWYFRILIICKLLDSHDINNALQQRILYGKQVHVEWIILDKELVVGRH